MLIFSLKKKDTWKFVTVSHFTDVLIFFFRASEANMSQICSQIEAVYRSNSRAEVTEALSAIVIDACVSVSMTPERLAMEMMLLITILHGNIGTEVGE